FGYQLSSQDIFPFTHDLITKLQGNIRRQRCGRVSAHPPLFAWSNQAFNIAPFQGGTAIVNRDFSAINGQAGLTTLVGRLSKYSQQERTQGNDSQEDFFHSGFLLRSRFEL